MRNRKIWQCQTIAAGTSQREDYIVSMLVDEQSSLEQTAIFRRMTPAQRWQAAHQLY